MGVKIDDSRTKKDGLWWLKTTSAITVFLLVGLGTVGLWFFSTLYPIVSQDRITMLGKEPELAGPRLNQDQLQEILDKNPVGLDLNSTKVEGVHLSSGVNIFDLGDLAEVLAPLVANMTYDEVAAFALDLNQGACSEYYSPCTMR